MVVSLGKDMSDKEEGRALVEGEIPLLPWHGMDALAEILPDSNVGHEEVLKIVMEAIVVYAGDEECLGEEEVNP